MCCAFCSASAGAFRSTREMKRPYQQKQLLYEFGICEVSFGEVLICNHFYVIFFCAEFFPKSSRKKAVRTAARREAAAERSDVALAEWESGGGRLSAVQRCLLRVKNPQAVRPGWISINTTTSTCQTQASSTDSHLGFVLAVRRPRPCGTANPSVPSASSFQYTTSCCFYPTVNIENTSEPLSHPGSHPLHSPDEPIAAPRACVAHIQQIDTNQFSSVRRQR